MDDLYEVTLPVEWRREDTTEHEVSQYRKLAERIIPNSTGLLLSDWTAEAEPDEDEDYPDYYWRGTFLLTGYAVASNQRDAVNEVVYRLNRWFEDYSDEDFSWCRGPELFIDGMPLSSYYRYWLT